MVDISQTCQSLEISLRKNIVLTFSSFTSINAGSNLRYMVVLVLVRVCVRACVGARMCVCAYKQQIMCHVVDVRRGIRVVA